MSPRGNALAGGAALVAASVAVALWQAPRIERDLTAASRQVLAARGVSGVQVRFDGRDAVLSGPGVTDAVVARVAGEPGVRRVRVERTAAGDAGARAVIAGHEASAVAGEIVELLGPDGLRFAAGSAEVVAAYGPALDRVAGVLVVVPSVRVQVAGYTDAGSDGAGAVELSRRRAAGIAGHLAARGVASERLVVDGYGNSRPVVVEGSGAAQAANRRVEITVLGG
jgi:outer membrane protein OmpA-like peptidoglycan-associated protein